MKRFLLSLVLLLMTFSSLSAQRDTEHWIAPMMDRYSSSGQQVLYFSTDSVTPFPVEIYNNNVVIGTVTISKGSPQTFAITNRSLIITTSSADCFTSTPKGLYMKGIKPYYVTLRFSVTSHAEIITSKGKAGIGTKFYAAYAPITESSSLYNFTTGIMATEDNTTVTVSGYSPTVIFSSGPTPTPATLTFTLNKGQSYIIEGVGNISANNTGFIGAKIISDKPVSVTNGNMNGQFALGSFDGSDIVMDQSVPVNRLGDEFVLVKGNGNIGKGMEGAVIIATENNTQIFINGSATPAATINEGQHYRINDDMWINQLASGHYNMFIKANKNVYVYQLLAGVATSSATLGYNYVPPLNCFLPRKIDEIGKINEMPGIAPDVKLNILTETGATVLVNSNPVPTSQGPFPVTGTTNWVSYTIPAVTGNVTVQSTKAVTAGVIGGSGVYGYGGYFAGFSSIPVIAKQTGDCIPGIILEVDDSFETYQWNLNGVAIPGATSNTYTPTIAGNYTVIVGVGSCVPLTTPIYKVFTCLQQTTKSLYICGSKAITPAFTNSTQAPTAGSVTIITQPTQGTATINPSTGVITYIPNPGSPPGTQDIIVYKFCGNAPEFVDCEQVTLNLNLVPFVLTDRTLKACQYSGNGFFDLTTANVTDNAVPTTKKFYPTLADLTANTNQISNPTNYFSGAGSVYVFVTTSEGCFGTAKITLEFFPTPVVNDATLTVCFLPNNETKGLFDLTSAVISIETPITKKYYPTFVDASNGTNEILNPTLYISGDGSVYARVYNSNGCYAIAKINLKVTPPKRSTTLVDKFICIDERITLDAGAGFTSYKWNTGATTQTLPGVAVGEYWVILENNGCFIKQFVSVKKVGEPVITSIEISNSTATVNVQGGNAPYQYAVDTPANWQNSNVFTNLSRGQHRFFVKDAANCDPVSVEITVPNLVNAITPNGDNVNDFLDYSELAYKGDLTFVIYDRYGNKLFTGDRSNNYKWDGKFAGKGILTGTYWYHINWIEPNAQKTPIKYTGWILVKNRE
ncbi:gliding motility-associated C-terminal domain-containing protein [Chryseobacterium aahli]|uniref:T9SS type B sorting domain-containing protein n=1 Tax=Chryseobacterium aahli TaxID=1278643 RepID=UPI001F60F26A|nr:T9SS type B sorting domain-containing protein [Chryseobacterium aahli]MCI3938153.1 gliding motility-associated C-terminal domain-containing protein [Chryseobacterium aahli]